MMRVAMIVRSTFYSVRGGDSIQAIQTARFLENHGVKADIKLTHEKIDYNCYQLLHFFNITRPADILFHIRKTNIPFVVSTILINYDEYDKFHRKGIAGLLFRHLGADSIEYIKSMSRWILGRDKMMSLSYILRGQKRAIHEIMQKVGMLLPNSDSEYERLGKQYNCHSDYMVVPNAVNQDLFRFDRTVRKDRKLVLCVARIEGLKNQLNLIKALNHTDYHLIIVGAAAPNQLSYYRTCRAIAAKNIQFIEQLPQEELIAYYQKAKVHVLPSWFETTGLSSLEAGAMGCNIVITEKGDTKEYFGHHAFYCSPESPDSIYKAVEKASLASNEETLQLKIADQYTWQKASMLTARGYRNTIEKSCR